MSKLSNKYIELLQKNILAIIAIADTVRATLGPKGMDVLLVDQYGNFTCTNDGVEILSNVENQSPIAKLLIDAAKSQETKVGDGTTTVSVLCAAILDESLKAVEKGISPVKLAEELLETATKLKTLLKKETKSISTSEQLLEICKIAARGNEKISKLIIETAEKISPKISLSNCIKAELGGESQLINGLLINKKPHFNYQKNLKDAACLVIEGAFEPASMPLEAIGTDEGVKKFSNHLSSLEELSKKIIKSGIKAIFIEQSIPAAIEELFYKEDILVLTRLSKADLNNICISSGATAVSKQKLISADQNQINNFAGRCNEITVTTESLIISGAKEKICSILISSQTPEQLNELVRISKDASRAVEAAKSSGYVAGAGMAEWHAATKLEIKNKGDEIFAAALKKISTQILENAGLEELYLENTNPQNPFSGIDLETGAEIDLEATGIIDPLEVKLSAVEIAAEVSAQILRINRILKAR